MISFCILDETFQGMYNGVRDGNLGQIGSNMWDTTKTFGRGIATGAKAIGNGAMAAGQHVARNKEAYGYGGLLGLGLAGGAYLAHEGWKNREIDPSLSQTTPV